MREPVTRPPGETLAELRRDVGRLVERVSRGVSKFPHVYETSRFPSVPISTRYGDFIVRFLSGFTVEVSAAELVIYRVRYEVSAWVVRDDGGSWSLYDGRVPLQRLDPSDARSLWDSSDGARRFLRAKVLPAVDAALRDPATAGAVLAARTRAHALDVARRREELAAYRTTISKLLVTLGGVVDRVETAETALDVTEPFESAVAARELLALARDVAS